jgi:hypothetical protein
MTATAAGQKRFEDVLRARIWRTKGARFNAYRRMQAKSVWSQRALSFLSAYVIILSLPVAVPVFGLSDRATAVAGVGLLGVSILILVVSVLESGRDYSLRAERLHRCGQALVDLQNELDLLTSAGEYESVPVEELRRLKDRYSAIIEACPDNHAPLDDAVFRSSHPSDFKYEHHSRLRLSLAVWWSSTGPYWLLAVVPALFIVAWIVVLWIHGS